MYVYMYVKAVDKVLIFSILNFCDDGLLWPIYV
jgi:hypothetical protein